MHSKPRALPFVLVGMFVVLLIGGIAWSVSSAPPLAQQRLQNAAEATMAASGFSLKDTNSVTTEQPTGRPAPGTQPGGTVIMITYGAPQSLEETELDPNGGSVSLIVIGDRRFQKTDSPWTELPPVKGLGVRAVATILFPLRAAVHATDVTSRGDDYRFVPTDLHGLLSALLGPYISQLSSPRLTAVVRGGYLTAEDISAVVGHQRLAVDLVFSAVGSSPPVRAPTTS